ncbi:MAG: hypothetical protein VKJ24_07695 [Synechococcales bacterium]|nr:hypothetical protein [Synechococcales bacterium]
MNYLVAVFADRAQAEAALTQLETAEKSSDPFAILGSGYQSIDEFGLPDPSQDTRTRARLMASWLVPFGFLGGMGFNLSTHLNTFPWAGPIGNVLLGGVLGAIGGGMGGVFMGGGVGILDADSTPYRTRLAAGKYLVVVQGGEFLIRRSLSILRQADPESLKSYGEDGLS